MKPAPFEYHDPASTQDVLDLLGRYGDDAKLLAGGQSLVPLLNLRLARPAQLIDLNRVGELAYIKQNNGGLAIGAMTRQSALGESSLVRERQPLLAQTIPLIGHFQIRNRGTIGGSLAHADPAAELPAVAAVCDAELVVSGASGSRTVAPAEFFVTYLTTSLEPTELLTEIRFPAWPARAGGAFLEVARRHGDFALVGCAAVVTLGDTGTIRDARLAFIGVGGGPVRVAEAEQALRGQKPDAEAFAAAAAAVRAGIEPESDLHASAEYRREVAGTLAQRALAQAAQRAQG